MQRRHRDGEHEREDRWLLTYADMITLLMVFFVVMWSISRADALKFAAVAQSMSIAFGTPRGTVVPMPAVGTSRSPKEAPTDDSKNWAAGLLRAGGGDRQTTLQSLANEIEEMIHEQGLQDMIGLDGTADGRKLTIRLRDSILFDQGESTLTPEARQLIKRLGGLLKDIGMVVNVAGHTDADPTRGGGHGSNYELSTARSTTVVMELIDQVDFPPEMIFPSGYGEYRPVAPNDTPENRAKNRRVEFVIVDDGAINYAGKSMGAKSPGTEERPIPSVPVPPADL